MNRKLFFSMSILKFFFGNKKKPETQVKHEIQHNKESSLAIKGLIVHPDIKNLLWIGEGPLKNYNQEVKNKSEFEIDGFLFQISFMEQEEPSLIYPSQKVEITEISGVEKPPYFPTYKDLTHNQKWVYANFLSNPYNPNINIGYVFILYYGLERHILEGNFEQTFEVILKLRDVHPNSSFQYYSAQAIILSCMLYKRPDLLFRFLESLDKEYEYSFSNNLFLLCCYSFEIPLMPVQIMKMSKSFGHQNQNYIKREPDLFMSKIADHLKEKYGTDYLNVREVMSSKSLQTIIQKKEAMFANVSIRYQEINVPQIISDKSLNNTIKAILNFAHEEVKKHLADARKDAKNNKTQNK